MELDFYVIPRHQDINCYSNCLTFSFPFVLTKTSKWGYCFLYIYECGRDKMANT